MILTPVELEGLAGPEGQWNERASSCGLLLTVPVLPPGSGKGRNTIVRTAVAKTDEIGVNLTQGSPLFARLAGLRLQPSLEPIGEGIKLACALWRRKPWLNHI